ncbi:hypothetical protein KALB_6420 [Kutzneria albida DSM 43870]|uniref:Major facilitator superfamily (MFS) profile domain-containing protein n=1 Tax=Kutzneria albida DSM 43870 TaxID=1449976 RepID=W5WNP0_9PSEU|nr:hypothetical protein KALB_6420 [Kutzneria albida DSM 43870]
MVAMTTALTGYSLLEGMVVPSIPLIQARLGLTAQAGSLLLVVLLVSASVALPIVGKLTEVADRRRILLWVLGIACAGAAVSSVANSLPVMLLGQLLQGAGAGMIPLCFAATRDQLPTERIPLAVGVITAVSLVATTFGQMLAGPIVESLSYHGVFGLPLVPMLAGLLVVWRIMPGFPPGRTPSRVDWLGGALFLSALLIAVLGLGLVSYLALLVLLPLWIRVELRAANPLVDMRMMRRRELWTSCVVALAGGFGATGAVLALINMVAQDPATGIGLGATVTEVSLYLLPGAVGSLVASPLAGRVIRATGHRPIVATGSAVMGCGFLALVFLHTAPWHVYLATGLIGTGSALVSTALYAGVMSSVDVGQTGVATSMLTISRIVGGSIGGTVCTALASAGSYGESGYVAAFALGGLASGLSLAMCALIPVRARAGSALPAR